jgi:hypothetical protein
MISRSPVVSEIFDLASASFARGFSALIKVLVAPFLAAFFLGFTELDSRWNPDTRLQLPW